MQGMDAGILPVGDSNYHTQSGRPLPNWRTLHLAAYAGYAPTAELLVEKGADRRGEVYVD
jgi:hypothetical protein